MVEALRRSKLRWTSQRAAVAREMARTDAHPDVEAVYLAVRKSLPNISLDTVYRTLGALAEAGVIRRVSTTAGPVRYDANTARHHHFVCTRCGLIRDVTSAGLDAVVAPEQVTALGRVEEIEVQMRGICQECRRKERDHE